MVINCTPFHPNNRSIDTVPSRNRRKVPLPFKLPPIFPEYKNPINPFSDLKENPFLNPKNKHDSLLPGNATSTLSPPNTPRPFESEINPLEPEPFFDPTRNEPFNPSSSELEPIPNIPNLPTPPIGTSPVYGYGYFLSTSFIEYQDNGETSLDWGLEIVIVTDIHTLRLYVTHFSGDNNWTNVSSSNSLFKAIQTGIDDSTTLSSTGTGGGTSGNRVYTQTVKSVRIVIGNKSTPITASPAVAPPKPRPKTPIIPRPSRQPGQPNIVPFKRPKKKPLPAKPEPKPKEEPKTVPQPDTAPNKPKPVFIPFIRPKIIPKPEPVRTPNKPKFDPTERPRPNPFKRPDRERKKNPNPSPNTVPRPNRKPNPPNNDPYKNRDRQTNNPDPMPTVNTPWGECSCPVPPNNTNDEDTMVIRWERITVREGKPVQNPVTRMWSLQYVNKTVTVLGSANGSEAEKTRQEWEHRNLIQEDLVAARNQRNIIVSAALSTKVKVTALLASVPAQIALQTLNVGSNIVNLMYQTRDMGETALDLVDFIARAWLPKYANFTVTDEEGNTETIGITDKVGYSMNEFLANILGTENYLAFRAKLAVTSRIYHAAYNVVDTVRDFTSTSWRLAEITVGNIGKVGNALRRSGQVFEDSYDTLEETFFGSRTNMIGKLTNGLERVENGIDAVATIAGATKSVQDTRLEIIEESAALTEEIGDYHQDVIDRENQIKTESGIDLDTVKWGEITIDGIDN